MNNTNMEDTVCWYCFEETCSGGCPEQEEAEQFHKDMAKLIDKVVETYPVRVTQVIRNGNLVETPVYRCKECPHVKAGDPWMCTNINKEVMVGIADQVHEECPLPLNKEEE